MILRVTRQILTLAPHKPEQMKIPNSKETHLHVIVAVGQLYIATNLLMQLTAEATLTFSEKKLQLQLQHFNSIIKPIILISLPVYTSTSTACGKENKLVELLSTYPLILSLFSKC